MRLVHFTNADELAVESRRQPPVPHNKPRGLWVSDESDGSHGWSSWCADEEFGLGRNVFAVEVADAANILILTTVDAIREFDEQYAASRHPNYRYHHRCFIDWQAVAARWQGILITPYQWQLRLSDVAWYYTWDCASGCIWDATAVASVTAVVEATA